MDSKSLKKKLKCFAIRLIRSPKYFFKMLNNLWDQFEDIKCENRGQSAQYKIWQKVRFEYKMIAMFWFDSQNDSYTRVNNIL